MPSGGRHVESKPLPYVPVVTGHVSRESGSRRRRSIPGNRERVNRDTPRTKNVSPKLAPAQPGHQAATAYEAVSSGGARKVRTPRLFRSGTSDPTKWSRGSKRLVTSSATPFGAR